MVFVVGAYFVCKFNICLHVVKSVANDADTSNLFGEYPWKALSGSEDKEKLCLLS